MSEYMFGVGSAAVGDKLGRKINRIARKHGAEFVWCRLPEGWRYWFATRNYGAPFDEATRDAVYADLDAAERTGKLTLPAGLRAKAVH